MAHRLTPLCGRNTFPPVFRRLVGELVTLLAYEATCGITVCKIDVVTPVAPTKGLSLAYPRPILVPIPRTGLGMLEGMSRLLSTVETSFLGMKRDGTILETYTYANHLSDDLSGRQCYVVGPIFAIGHTFIDAVNYLLERSAHDVTYMCLLAAPEVLRNLGEAIGDRADVTIASAAFDGCLNENGYIVPGPGDAGDRLYGIVD